MSGGGTQSTQNASSTQSSLPSWLSNAYQNQLGNATNLLSADTAATSGAPSLLSSGLSSIAGVNPTAITGANSTLTNMLNGGFNTNATTGYNAASPAIASEASGSLMNVNSNPYEQQELQLMDQNTQNSVDSQFGAAGRNVLASAPVQADQTSTNAANLLSSQYATNVGATGNAQSLASGNYNTGVGQIGAAAATAPSVTSGLYVPGTTQLAAGQTPNSLASWYSTLLGQTAAPFGQQTTTGATGTQNTLGPLATASGILGLL